jgi:putative flippase GtrA
VTLTSCIRLVRFSLVGALGVGVQLGVLAALIATKMNYLLATGLAVEVAVLHNFSWHQRFTWPDRASDGIRAALAQLLRFYLSNGLISIAGNLVLMRLLVGRGWPVLAANLATISLCFVANYLASDRWVFLAERPLAHQQQRALGEGKINQCRSGRQRQAQPDLRCEQERRKRPELIEREDPGEQAKEFSTETAHVKPDSRKQVQANRNANCSRRNQSGGDPRRVPENVFQQLLNYTEARQGRDVEAEIQDLDKQKKHAYVPVRNRRQIFGTGEQRGRCRRLGSRALDFGG